MYDIYWNQHRLVFAASPPDHPENWSLILPYRGQARALHAVLDILEKRPEASQLCLHAPDIPALWADFSALFRQVPAAGGLVDNGRGEWLFIERNGYLDLPKGKLDEGEDFASAARREVLEETGLHSVVCDELAGITWHAYREKKVRCLKQTQWFYMSDPRGPLHPQADEGITAIHWLRPADYLQSSIPRYPGIDALVRRVSGL